MLKEKSKIYSFSAEIITAIYMTVSVIPGYFLIGSLIQQVIITFIFTSIFLFFADRLGFRPVTIARALSIMTIFWTILAVVLQIKLHISLNDYSLTWFHLFYYDKIAMLYVTIFTAWLYYIIKLLTSLQDKSFINEYLRFIKITSVTLLVFYFATLLYCFVLCRSPGFEREPANLIPFIVIKNTFLSGRIDYEYLFLFLGNIAIFLPLGVMIDIFLKGRANWILIATPIIVSTGIEISQYYLKLGNCDIDDIILNVLGFYLGVIIKRLLDKLLQRFSHGKLNSVFAF